MISLAIYFNFFVDHAGSCLKKMDLQYYLVEYNRDRVHSNLNQVSVEHAAFLDYFRRVRYAELQLANVHRRHQGLRDWTDDDEEFIIHFNELTDRRRLARNASVQITPTERRRQVVHLHREGMTIKDIATRLSVHRTTIERDFISLGLQSFTPISDYQLRQELQSLFDSEHDYVGYRNLEGGLVSRGFRVQRQRIMDMMVTYKLNIIMYV